MTQEEVAETISQESPEAFLMTREKSLLGELVNGLFKLTGDLLWIVCKMTDWMLHDWVVIQKWEGSSD